MTDLDHAYDGYAFALSELQHHFGPRIHLLTDPFLLTQLLHLCEPATGQPQITYLVRDIYKALARLVIAAELPRQQVAKQTRMAASTPRAVWQGSIIAPQTQVVTVDVARAGTLPSQVVFETLLQVLAPDKVRQDHLFMNRVIDARGQVTDVCVSGNKIGGSVGGSVVLLPDPMGATGGSMARAANIYKSLPGGGPKKMIALNLIVTPEYLTHLQNTHPDVEVYAVRLDRGMSDAHVFARAPGSGGKDERGLNAQQYIVPGAGGLGEILNNTDT